MTPLLAIPAVQAQPPIQTSAVVGMPTQISTMKLPLDAVPSTVQAEPAYNNTRGAGASRGAPTLTTISSPSISGSLSSLISGLDFRPSVQFSSPFLAQLFAQTPGSQLQAMTEFFVNDNTPKYVADPALMALYSQVKYKPSEAALSSPAPEHSFTVMKQQQQHFMQQLADQKTQQMQSQVRPQPAAQAPYSARQIFISLPQETSDSSSSPRAPQNTGGKPREGSTLSSPFTPASFRSLVQPTGVDAYIASFSRNFANLNAQPDAVKIAL